ncbi:hypothetical protein KDK95_04120 [Actinospica sp. MGRD01-02]|uniref:Uncharacterized protein n=1 Tax=Actinospica acidithermotolerans TaxID=2828514 RepID=A0A941IFW3_9ACTN|nr:hypothetical protein [Actinospica acidithermotolerans]MBR7825479.1 hypothetical protein [Actinospica acidithermotolerans]
MEITDVTTIDRMSDAEVDELLARALSPHTPVEIFYAVLDRIGGIPAAAPEAMAYPDAEPVPDAEPAADPAPAEEPVLAEVGSEA